MEIITAADSKFKEMAKSLESQATQFGYDSTVYDLGGLGFGRSHEIPDEELGDGLTIGNTTYLPKCQYKPFLLAMHLFDTEHDKVVYLDSDTSLVQPIDEVFDEEFDVGVTMRRQNERNLDGFAHISGLLNAGVIFLRKTEGANDFLNYWADAMWDTTSGSDQEALNNVVLRATDLTEYNKVFEYDGIKIKVFDTDTYNNYYFGEQQKGAKILHYKGNYKKLWKKNTRG